MTTNRFKQFSLPQLTLLLLASVLAASVSSVAVHAAAGNQTIAKEGRGPVDGQVHILPVRGDIYMLVGAGANITVQVGNDGILLVDAGLASMSEQVLAAVRSLSDKPIRYIIDTSIDPDHTGGNEAIAKAGSSLKCCAPGGQVYSFVRPSGATILAFEGILDRMSAANSADQAPEGALPTDTYTGPKKFFFFNNEGIQLFHQSAAHTDADTIVFFRRSDVVSAGDIFTTAHYPVIDLKRGGSIQGIISGLNRLIYEITIPADKEEGGTMVVPGHGRLCDRSDVVSYQEMVIILRDRVQYMIKKGMTLEQVKAARPTQDYDLRYGSESGPWTTDMFVEAVYKNLTEETKPGKH
jgi:cyclase